MIKVFVSSSVSNSNISVDLADILSVLPSNDLFSFDWSQVMFVLKDLEFIKIEISRQIQLLENERNLDDSKLIPYTELNYNDIIWKLNYKDKVDFKIGILISLFNIVCKAIERNGDVTLFNLTYLNQLFDSMIFNILKLGKQSSVNDIYKEIVELSKEYKSVTPIPIENIPKSIDNLMIIGFIDQEDANYKVTAKGYMFQL